MMTSDISLVSMPHVSRKKILNKTFVKISDDLIISVLRARNRKDAASFIRGLFTKTERIMFAKRLAALHLLSRGVSTYQVVDILKLSDSSVRRFRNMLLRKDIIILLKKTGRRDVLGMLEVFLSAGFPPRGKGRWRSFYEIA